MPVDTIERRIRLAEAAQKYYVEGWSQDEVAELLGTSRSNVSRLLDSARRTGVIRFVIDHPLRRHAELEAALTADLAAGEALVVAGPDPELELVGRVGAIRLAAALETASRVAIGWGRGVEAVVRQVAIDTPLDIEVVQVGGDLTVAPAPSGHELVRMLAVAIGGQHRFLHAPAFVESETVATHLREDPRIAAGLELARRADVAVVGIGVPGVGFAETVVASSYRGDGAPAAVICARLVDDTGREPAGPLREQVIAIELDDLRRIPTVIGVAAGPEKGRAIAAALRGGLVDVIVCDQSAAVAALAHAREPVDATA